MDPITSNPAFILFAALCPLLIAVIKQEGFSAQVNSVIALACYVIVGILGALLSSGPFTLDNVVGLITIATLVGSAAYSLFWSQIGTGQFGVGLSIDHRIQEATSFKKAA